MGRFSWHSIMLLTAVIMASGEAGCAIVSSVRDQPRFANMVGREAVLEKDQVLTKQPGMKWLLLTEQESTSRKVHGIVEKGTRMTSVDVVSYESVPFSWYFAIARIDAGSRKGETVATPLGRFAK